MQKNILKKGLKLLGSAFFAGYMALALSRPVYAEEHNLNKNKTSFQVVLGGLSSSICKIGPESPDINYLQTSLRMGWVLDKPAFPRGNLEALFEVSGSKIYKGPGDHLIGLASFLRYNAVKPDWKFIPYAQLGAGIVYTDIYKDKSQDTIGQALNFTLQTSAGFNYSINEKWSVGVEVGILHASCGSSIFKQTKRNDGGNFFRTSGSVTYNF